MARIYGTIESLKSLKSELDNNDISRFNSVKEINDFLSNYISEKRSILNDESKKLDREYFETCTILKQRKQEKAEIINSETEKIDSQTFNRLPISRRNASHYGRSIITMRKPLNVSKSQEEQRLIYSRQVPQSRKLTLPKSVSLLRGYNTPDSPSG